VLVEGKSAAGCPDRAAHGQRNSRKQLTRVEINPEWECGVKKPEKNYWHSRDESANNSNVTALSAAQESKQS
jgi:hypothetical protein